MRRWGGGATPSNMGGGQQQQRSQKQQKHGDQLARPGVHTFPCIMPIGDNQWPRGLLQHSEGMHMMLLSFLYP
jgi:hypothetical protein